MIGSNTVEVSLLCLLLLGVACSEKKPVPKPAVLIPSSLHGTYVGRAREFNVYDSDIAVPDREWRLWVLEGRLDGETYQATRLGRARLGDDGWEVVPIEGTATLAPEGVRIALTGPAAPEWNGEYEPFATVQRRELEALARKNAESDGGTAGPGPCQQYRDCVCALSSAAIPRAGDNPFLKACADADRLLREAPDDPAWCVVGIKMHRELAPSLGLAIPKACPDLSD